MTDGTTGSPCALEVAQSFPRLGTRVDLTQSAREILLNAHLEVKPELRVHILIDARAPESEVTSPGRHPWDLAAVVRHRSAGDG
jgi:hypothetical protein